MAYSKQHGTPCLYDLAYSLFKNDGPPWTEEQGEAYSKLLNELHYRCDCDACTGLDETWKGNAVVNKEGKRPALLIAGTIGGGTRTAAYMFNAAHEALYNGEWHEKVQRLPDKLWPTLKRGQREASGFSFFNLERERDAGTTIIHVTRDPAHAIRTIHRKFGRYVPEGWSAADYWVHVHSKIEPWAHARLRIEDFGVVVGGGDKYKSDGTKLEDDPGPFNPYADPRVEDMARRYGYLEEPI